jgi:hypothetical protein
MIKKTKPLLIFTLLSICFSVVIHAAEVRMPKKWHKLNKLLDQEEKTIATITRMGPRLKWRLIELGTERIKLIKEKENKTFLSAKPSYRKKKGKKFFFKKSTAKYKEVRRDALRLMRKWPRFNYNSEIYFTLALNSRDYGGDKETEKFLLKSLKVAIPRSPIIHSAKTSLAEYYYNSKKYKKAIRYYKDVLKNTEDEWYTKHLYNVSWCYIKTKQYDAAIDSAKLSFFTSKNKSYISVKRQVLDSIGFFFVLGERVKEGASFYIDNVESPGEYMIKMAKKTADDKGYELANFVFDAALSNSIDKKNTEEEVEIRLSQLDFFRNFKKFEKFWNTTVALDKINKVKPIGEDFKVTAVEKIRSFVGYLQVRFTRNSKTNIESYSQQDKNRILNFFEVLSRLNPPKTDSYHFYQGETLFAVNEFKQSFSYYQKGLEFNKLKDLREKLKNPKRKVKKVAKKRKASNSKKIQKKKIDPKLEKMVKSLPKMTKEEKVAHTALKVKFFDSLLASLENGTFSKDLRYKNTVYTYQNHIDIYPKNPRSRIIYRKLFNLHLTKLDIKKSMPILNRYIAAYKVDKEIQQGMFTKVMDYFIKTKASDRIAEWIPKLRSGFLSFETKYIDKAVLILGSILFDKYQKLDIAGSKKEAAIGYTSLYESKKYPKSIKAKSAYRASILYLDLYQTKKAKKWMTIALRLFTKKERFERKKEILAVVQNMMLAQDFSSAAFVATDYLKIYCYTDFAEKEDLYRASVQYQLLEGKTKQAYTNYKLGRKCGMSKAIQNEALLGIGTFFYNNRQTKQYNTFFKYYNKRAALKKFFNNTLLATYWDQYLNENKSGMKATIKRFKKIFAKKGQKKTRAQREIETAIAFEKVITKLKKVSVDYLPNHAKFKEDKFNQALERNIETLKGITAELTPYIKSGYPHLITRSYDLLEKKYTKLALSISSFSPKGVPNDYVVGFRGAMKGLAQNLFQEARSQKRTAINLINKEKILALKTRDQLSVPKIFKEIRHRHPASLYAMPTDKTEAK